MEKNIDATLDIAKSLKDFESQVTKLLELTNVKEWDGRIFKEREEKIRNAAIILAGQCIALLLYNLSQPNICKHLRMLPLIMIKSVKIGFKKHEKL